MIDTLIDMLAAMWAAIRNYGKSISAYWREGRKGRAVGKVVLPCLPLVLVGGIVFFVATHWEAIMSFLVAVIAIACIIGGLLNSQAERKRKEAERLEQLKQEAIRENARTADATYIKMAKVIYDVARDLGSAGIVPPRALSDIYSSGSRMISLQDGAVMLALFTLQKSGQAVDTEVLSITIQEKIDKKLSAGELPGINRDVTYNGRVYSGFIIDAVVDRPGFAEVYAVLTDENYCRFKADCELQKGVPGPSVDRRDTDY